MYNELIDALRERAEAYEEHNAMFGFRGGKCYAEHLLNDAADAIERLTAEREQIRDKLIRRICSHCDSVLVGCEGCPIIGEVKAVFDEQQS